MDLVAQVNRGGEALAPCFMVALFGLIVVVVLLIHWGWQASFRRKLESVARHLGGRVVLLGGFGAIHFEHLGYPAEIRFSKRGKSSHYTHLEIRWPGPRFRCEIYPESFLASLRKLMGMQDIVIGSPRFDSAFIITGDDEAGIKALLNVQVQSAIFNLAEYVRGMHVRIGDRSLTVTCAGLLSDFARLVEFAKLCRELCEAAVAAQGHGIEFLDGAAMTMTAPAAGAARCMVCGELLAAEIVYCRRCKTPHHRECWSYGGGCSTYGCGEKKFAAKS